jgi:hypothetical protein
MTDFVDRLLGRSALPAIRPLIPTLFEPLWSRDGDEPLPMGTFTETAASAVSEVRGGEGGVRPPTSTAQPPAAPDRSPPQISAAVGQRLSVTRVETHHRHTRTGFPVAVPLPAAVIPPDVDVPAAAMPPGAEPPRPLAAPEPDRPHAAKPAAVSDIPQPTARRLAGSPVLSSRSVQPVVVRRQDRPRDPDVHISIGRVEITAKSEGRPRPRGESPKGPRLSLDDYLRDRGVDGR